MKIKIKIVVEMSPETREEMREKGFENEEDLKQVIFEMIDTDFYDFATTDDIIIKY